MPPCHLADPDVVVMECSVGVEQVALPKRPMRRNMAIHEGDMKRRLLFTALIACSMLAGATPAPVGESKLGPKSRPADTPANVHPHPRPRTPHAPGHRGIVTIVHIPI